MRRFIVLKALLAVMCVATSHAESVISVNFENWGSINQNEYAGVVDVANWNDTWLDIAKVSPMTNLRDSTGATTAASVAWTGGEWGIRLWDGTASGVDTDGRRNVSLMKGYLDAHAPATTTATFTEIPFASYNVYVYVMADVADRAGSVTIGDATYYFLTDPASLHFTSGGTADYMEFKEITATDAASAVRSNYVVFRGLTGSSFTASSTIPGGGGIAGVQIVEDAFRPTVTPENEDGTVGTLISQSQAEVTFGWLAGADPNTTRGYPVNPDIMGHYVFVSDGGEEATELVLRDYVTQIHADDPFETDPSNVYGPIVLDQGMTYYWQIQSALDDGTGTPYGPNDPNNIISPIWSFNTVGAVPQIFDGPEHAVADLDGNASFSVETGAVATDFRWFKVGDPDVQLTDGGIYSGTQTNTLVITGATVADEGQFYAIVYNGDPDAGGVPSLPSKTAIFWYPRLMSYFPFETLSGGVTPDVVSGFDMTMESDDTGDDVPVLDAGMPDLEGEYALKFDNPGINDPNNVDGQFAQIAAGVVDYKDITISLWVRPSTLPGWARVFDFGTGTDNYLFLTADAGWGVMRFAIRTPAVNEQLLETGALVAGQWSHVAVTITGNTGRLYRNGELVATNTNMTLNPIDVVATLNYLGKSQWPDAKYNGLIDDLKIWNYALSTVDVAQEYLGAVGGSVCNRETYIPQAYDVDGNCRIDLEDFAAFAEVWLADQRIYAN